MSNPTIEVQHNDKIRRYFSSKFVRLQDHFRKAGYTKRIEPDGNRVIMRFEKADSVKVFYVRNTVG